MRYPGIISRYRFIFFIEMREQRKPHRSVKCFITMERAMPPGLNHLGVKHQGIFLVIVSALLKGHGNDIVPDLQYVSRPWILFQHDVRPPPPPHVPKGRESGRIVRGIKKYKGQEIPDTMLRDTSSRHHVTLVESQYPVGSKRHTTSEFFTRQCRRDLSVLLSL
jgi:hypothetical protein